MATSTTINEMNKSNRGSGIENRGYQADAPKSPWRVAFRKPFVPPPYERNDSTSSIASSVASPPPKMSPLAMELQGFKKEATPPVHKELTRSSCQ